MAGTRTLARSRNDRGLVGVVGGIAALGDSGCEF